MGQCDRFLVRWPGSCVVPCNRRNCQANRDCSIRSPGQQFWPVGSACQTQAGPYDRPIIGVLFAVNSTVTLRWQPTSWNCIIYQYRSLLCYRRFGVCIAVGLRSLEFVAGRVGPLVRRLDLAIASILLSPYKERKCAENYNKWHDKFFS